MAHPVLMASAPIGSRPGRGSVGYADDQLCRRTLDLAECQCHPDQLVVDGIHWGATQVERQLVPLASSARASINGAQAVLAAPHPRTRPPPDSCRVCRPPGHRRGCSARMSLLPRLRSRCGCRVVGRRAMRHTGGHLTLACAVTRCRYLGGPKLIARRTPLVRSEFAGRCRFSGRRRDSGTPLGQRAACSSRAVAM